MPPAKRRPAATPQGRRKDPKSRRIDGSSKMHNIGNPDPTKKYTAVYKGQEGLIDEYLSMGYEVETKRDGGPQYGGRSVKNDGDELETSGHVLMSIDREDYDDISDNGVSGYTGQNGADRADFLRLKQGGDDPLRGQHARGVAASAEWKQEEPLNG